MDSDARRLFARPQGTKNGRNRTDHSRYAAIIPLFSGKRTEILALPENKWYNTKAACRGLPPTHPNAAGGRYAHRSDARKRHPFHARLRLPLILGNLLQQLYNVADTLIVGRFLGAGALAAVGSSFTLMTFLTSVLLGLCMGSGAVFSILWGARKEEELKASLFVSFLLVGAATLAVAALALGLLQPILTALKIPGEIRAEMAAYLRIIFLGLGFAFVYNYMAALLRSLGNAVLRCSCWAARRC